MHGCWFPRSMICQIVFSVLLLSFRLSEVSGFQQFCKLSKNGAVWCKWLNVRMLLLLFECTKVQNEITVSRVLNICAAVFSNLRFKNIFKNMETVLWSVIWPAYLLCKNAHETLAGKADKLICRQHVFFGPTWGLHALQELAGTFTFKTVAKTTWYLLLKLNTNCRKSASIVPAKFTM